MARGLGGGLGGSGWSGLLAAFFFLPPQEVPICFWFPAPRGNPKRPSCPARLGPKFGTGCQISVWLQNPAPKWVAPKWVARSASGNMDQHRLALALSLGATAIGLPWGCHSNSPIFLPGWVSKPGYLPCEKCFMGAKA